MDRTQLKEHLLRTLSLRVGDHMADYILHRRMTAAFASLPCPIPIIASDARTGIPVATTLAPTDLPVPASN